MLETLQQLDQQLLLTLNGLNSPYWDSFMWLFTGRFIWIPMYATILYILCKNINVYVTLLTAVAIALTITYADQLCATWIRPAVERLRPSNLNNPLSDFVHIVNGKRGGSYGFPSCHASNSFGLAFFLLFFFRQRWLSIFILCWAVLNCYTRIYLGVHYPGDLLAGMFVGLSGALIFYYLLPKGFASLAMVKYVPTGPPPAAAALGSGKRRGSKFTFRPCPFLPKQAISPIFLYYST